MLLRRVIPSLLCSALLAPAAWALPQCASVANAAIQQAGKPLDSKELTTVLQSLGQSGHLPPQFVSKRQAQQAGWQPGRNLWSVPGLQGKSIGGDRFGNYEQQLPKGQWQEADLNYKGGKRGAYRLVFSRAGQRFISLDHYQRFIEVPACQ